LSQVIIWVPPIEDAINDPAVAESAIVGFPHDIRERTLWLCNFKRKRRNYKENLFKEINQYISDHVGPIAKLDKIQFVSGLPKTRSGKIMRRILRKLQKVISLTLEIPRH
jgi:acetyl-CoA synthetase